MAESKARADVVAEPRLVYVKAATEMGDKVALWDRWPGHPDGEVFVAGQKSAPVRVDATAPAVTDAVHNKRLVILEGRQLQEAQDVAAAETAERDRARRAAQAERLSAAAASGNLQAQVELLTRQVNALAAEPAPAGPAAAEPPATEPSPPAEQEPSAEQSDTAPRRSR